MYDRALSEIYDSLTDFDYWGYYNFVSPYVRGEGVDLGCGSGTFTKLLRDAGSEVSGIDCSPEMLNKAAEKYLGDNINWILGDMKLIAEFSELDFITCVCDGFNYLSRKSLASVIAKCYGALKQGGTLIFDVSSEKKLKEISGNVYFYEKDGVSYCWCNYSGRDYVDMQLTIFKDRGDRLYERGQENQRQ